jgi:hypothetical protein
MQYYNCKILVRGNEIALLELSGLGVLQRLLAMLMKVTFK